MTNKLEIEVTQDDISNGKPMNSTSCPIALALIRQGITNEPDVEPHVIDYYDPETMTHYRANLPNVAQNFITHFDNPNWNEDDPYTAPFKFTVVFDTREMFDDE